MQPGDVVSYLEMCSREGASLQRGMNYQLGPDHSVLLMSVQPGAPYDDSVSEDGQVLVYEGHDEPKSERVPDPKLVDQPLHTPKGTPTQNGRFYRAAEPTCDGRRSSLRYDKPLIESATSPSKTSSQAALSKPPKNERTSASMVVRVASAS